MRSSIVIMLLVALLFGLMPACSTTTVPATVTVAPRAPIEHGSRIFLVARAHRERIVQSLADAGLDVSDDWTSDSYLLTVSVGKWRAAGRCSRVSNVAYVVSKAGQRFMVIKGRGGTGDCEPNVFDDMSRVLSAYVAKE